MDELFKDTRKQKQFDLLGFVSFPLLDVEAVGKLRAELLTTSDLYGQEGEFFRSTSGSGDSQLIDRTDALAREVILRPLTTHFQQFKVIGFNFFLKESGVNSAVPAHQDWTHVDEDRFRSMNIWIALQDVSESDGCLWFVPRSHRITTFLRSAPDYPWPYRSAVALLSALKISVPLKAGECVCFNNAIVHGSFANLSGKQRLSVVGCLYSEQAQLVHYFRDLTDGRDEMWRYELNSNSFLNLRKGEPPGIYSKKTKVEASFPSFSGIGIAARLLKLRLLGG